MDSLMDLFILDSHTDNIIIETESKEFQEFCNNIDKLDRISTVYDLYFEDVKYKPNAYNKMLSGTLKNTKDTTLDVADAYGNVISGGGELTKSVWDLFMGAVGLMTRILKFLLQKVAMIPRMILKISHKIANIPQDIKDKIHGNIKLYITVNDIETIYNSYLIVRLTRFIELGKVLSQGETWGTLMNKRKPEGIIAMKENDIATCKKINAEYNALKELEFTQSSIIMSDDKVKNCYFGVAATVEFVSEGKKYSYNYYEALNKLVDDIHKKEGDIKDVYKDLSEKYDKTQLNQSFIHLNKNAQRQIMKTMQQMSKIYSITGNIIRYIMIDLKTLEKETNKILKSSNINVDDISIKTKKK